MSDFNYKDTSAPKLSDEFKEKFMTSIKGKEAIKVEGLVAFANEKGIKSMKTSIIQFPSDANRWTCICETVVVGYGWDPVAEKVCEVVFSDIGDANETNCTAMVKASYIRMASTRSIGRALRKYTNIDMVCSAELSDMVEEAAPKVETITTELLTLIKALVREKRLNKEQFTNILAMNFGGDTNYCGYSKIQGETLASILSALPTPTAAPVAPAQS